MRALSADPDCALHVSIAGGRKTMGYYVGYALSLFGRPQDRLSHVLVSEPFESNWEFFYPAPASRVMTTRDNKLVDAADARVTLAEIPFLRLREGLPKRLIEGAATFGESVEAAQRALAPPDLAIDLAGGRIRAGGEVVPLPPAILAFYALMARRRLKGMHAARWDTEGLAQQYLAEYRRIAGDLSGDLERVERGPGRRHDPGVLRAAQVQDQHRPGERPGPPARRPLPDPRRRQPPPHPLRPAHRARGHPLPAPCAPRFSRRRKLAARLQGRRSVPP